MTNSPVATQFTTVLMRLKEQRLIMQGVFIVNTDLFFFKYTSLSLDNNNPWAAKTGKYSEAGNLNGFKWPFLHRNSNKKILAKYKFLLSTIIYNWYIHHQCKTNGQRYKIFQIRKCHYFFLYFYFKGEVLICIMMSSSQHLESHKKLENWKFLLVIYSHFIFFQIGI